MLSMRAVSALAVLDRVTGEVKWTMRGPFLRQHDPDTLPDGTLLVFDNRSRNLAKSGGNSRIVRIDPLSMQPLWTYEGSQAHPFFTNIQGKLQPLPNGNILVVEAEGGRIFEIEQPSGEIVWEFINLLTSDERIVGRVTQAEREGGPTRAEAGDRSHLVVCCRVCSVRALRIVLVVGSVGHLDRYQRVESYHSSTDFRRPGNRSAGWF